MPGSVHDVHNNGKKARDAALTWLVPAPLEAEKAAVAGRAAFGAVAGKHLQALVQQLLEAEAVEDVGAWAPVVCQLAQAAAAALSPTAAVAQGKLDPRYYIKVKRIVTPGSSPADSSLVQGVACRKSLAHKRMRGSIPQPRIMLLGGVLEMQRSPAAASAGGKSQLSSFDALLDQEQQYLAGAVDRIASYSPDVLLVERSVARYAQELLLARDISLVLNVKLEMLERLARCTGSQVAPSLDELTSHCVGFCKEFEVESLQPASSAAAAAAAAANSAEVSPRTPDTPDGHIVADSAALRKVALGVVGGPRALMLFRGCPRPLGCTILLRGVDPGELRRVKRVAAFAAYAAYWGILETALLSDQLAAAAAAVLPGSSQQPDAVAGAADAVAFTSFLATAEARGRQAILSASPHVSIVLERGSLSADLDLPLPRAEGRLEQPGSGDGGGGDDEDGDSSSGGGSEAAGPDSPASSDSTNMWVLPADAGAATFTVSGGPTADPSSSEEQQQGEEGGGGGGADALLGCNGGGYDDLLSAPGSPQDPLHLAAKELALQQLQLTGSQPPSPAASPSAAAAAGGADAADQQLQQAAYAGGREGEAASAQVSPRSTASGALAAAPQQQQQLQSSAAVSASAAAVLRRASSAAGAAATAPGAMAYSSQQLWLAISCKNPAKGILCEPSHAHCMEFYADTDLPLAAFLSAAAPPNRKCPHPQCGEGAPLHLRSFMHANGLVTLSSVRLPAGKELPEGRVWLWLRPAGGRGSGGSASELAPAVRRVALSAEAACLSFAHLLSLLLDARHLALGGLSLQRDFVRYLGAGSTLLCLHYSPATPYVVRMPPRQVELLLHMESEWLQDEIKQLTEEADEAFTAIEYALVEQLRVLEAADPEFQQMWQDTLADTRTTFLDVLQDTITLLDFPHQQQQQQQQAAPEPNGGCSDAVHVVWELNRLRSMLAAVVLQWATCLHEGSPSSNAAPPSGATAALTSALQTRRAAAHSRHVSTDAAAFQGSDAAAAAEGDMPSSPFSQAGGDQRDTVQQRIEAAAGVQQQQREEQVEQQPGGQQADPTQQASLEQPAVERQLPPAIHVPASAAATAAAEAAAAASQARDLQRSYSGRSLGRQFLEAGGAMGTGAAVAASEATYGAPSLWAEEADRGFGGGGGESLAASPHASGGAANAAPIATGLVARYIALFDQRGEYGGGGSRSSSPSALAGWSQRTREWVQTASPANSPRAGDAEAAAERQRQAASPSSSSSFATGASPATAAGGETSRQTAQQEQQQEQQNSAQPPQGSGGGSSPDGREQQQQQRRSQRPSFFRLDLTNPDPELVHALSPRHRSYSDEAEALPVSLGGRMEQIAARLGRMSLSQSFTERRRSATLGHAQSADQLASMQQLPPAAADEPQQQQQEAGEQMSTLPQETAGQHGVQPHPSPFADDGTAGGSGTPQQAAPAPVAVADSSTEPAPDGELLPQSSAQGSVSHFDEWRSLLQETPSGAEGEAAPPPAGTDTAGAAGAAGLAAAAAAAGVTACSEALAAGSSSSPLQAAPSGRQDAIGKLQDAPMPPALSSPAGKEAGADAAAAAPPSPLAASPPIPIGPPEAAAAAAGSAPAAVPVVRAASLPPVGRGGAAILASSAPAATATGSCALSGTAVSAPLPALVLPALPLPPLPPPPLPEKQPNKLMQLLGKLRSEMQPGHMPLTAGKVELSGRALLPSGAGGMRVAIFDDEPTSIIAYFLATKEYQQYLHEAVATILFGGPGQRSSGVPPSAAAVAAAAAVEGTAAGEGEQGAAAAAAAVPASSQTYSDSPRGAAARRRSSLVPGLQQAGRAAAAVPAAAGAAAAAAVPEDVLPAQAGAAAAAVAAAAAGLSQEVSQEAKGAEQSGDWQVLFHEQQLDCQLAMEDLSPGMPWGRAKFQITAYYAPQFAELRRRCVAGGEGAFLASISRCRKWASRGGKSAVYFARSCDKRYIIKQLSRSERQSFLEFAPDYFRYVATMLHRGQDTCLAKILGVYQVSVQYTGGRGAPSAPPFGTGKEGVMDLLITENVFYGRDAHINRIYDLKGSQRDRYAADNPAMAGAVLLDENLKELNLSAPTLVGPRAYARLQRALWSDTSFLAGLGVMDYSLVIGVDKERQELVVGVIDYIRQFTWDKQVETWVKKSGILGGAGKDPTVISPKQYSRRFRIAMSSYLTVVPAWEPPDPPLDPDAM